MVEYLQDDTRVSATSSPRTAFFAGRCYCAASYRETWLVLRQRCFYQILVEALFVLHADVLPVRRAPRGASPPAGGKILTFALLRLRNERGVWRATCDTPARGSLRARRRVSACRAAGAVSCRPQAAKASVSERSPRRARRAKRVERQRVPRSPEGTAAHRVCLT